MNLEAPCPACGHPIWSHPQLACRLDYPFANGHPPGTEAFEAARRAAAGKITVTVLSRPTVWEGGVEGRAHVALDALRAFWPGRDFELVREATGAWTISTAIETAPDLVLAMNHYAHGFLRGFLERRGES
jgi:hypothetical protein